MSDTGHTNKLLIYFILAWKDLENPGYAQLGTQIYFYYDNAINPCGTYLFRDMYAYRCTRVSQVPEKLKLVPVIPLLIDDN